MSSPGRDGFYDCCTMRHAWARRRAGKSTGVVCPDFAGIADALSDSDQGHLRSKKQANSPKSG